MENIEYIRRNAIIEIKEKIDRNKKYTPCCKEFREDMKNLGFDNGNSYIFWMQNNGILKNPANIYNKKIERTVENAGCKTLQEYRNKCAQKLGFNDNNDRQRKSNWYSRNHYSMSENEDCSLYFGVYIAENYIMKTFEDPIKAPMHNPGYDWICKKGQKIDHKASCLIYDDNSNWKGWYYVIDHNHIADYFILSSWDNRYCLNPLHVWIFHRNDIIRGNPFWMRGNIAITDNQKKLKEFEKYEVTDKLEKLRELCNNLIGGDKYARVIQHPIR